MTEQEDLAHILRERLSQPIEGLSQETQKIRERMLDAIESGDTKALLRAQEEYSQRPEVIEERDKLFRLQLRDLEFDMAEPGDFAGLAEEFLKGDSQND